MHQKRFSGLAGQEYNLRAKAVPHHHRMQQLVGKTLAENFKGTNPFILEVGCGTGITTDAILSQLPDGLVDAIDNERTMLDQAELNLHKYVIQERCDLIHEDTLLFLKSGGRGRGSACNHYFAIASAMTIHNFDQQYRKEVMKLIYQFLEKDGVFINADKYALDDPIAHQKTLNRQLEQFQKVAREESKPEFAEERTEHYLRDNEPDLLMKQQEAIDEMKKIGFKDIQIIFREQMEAILVARK